MTRIAVVDNHGQFTHLEHRMLRDLGVDSDVVPNDADPASLNVDGLILSGGPDIERRGRCSEYLDLDRPVLGICLGMQIIAEELGGSVEPGEYGGYADVTVSIDDPNDPIVGSLAPETRVWASHADQVATVPDGFSVSASSDICPIEAMSHADRDLYGVQWHPEVAHTDRGEEVFENFLDRCDS